MRHDELVELYEFNHWANARILEAASRLEPESFTRDVGSSFPSVRDTLVHITSAEWVWLQRWTGTSPTAMPDGWREFDLPGVTRALAEVETAQLAFVHGLSNDDIERVIHYRNLAGDGFAESLSRLLRHVVNHSSYHRGQITTMLRQLGASSIATDLVVFYRQRPAAITG